ncbi:ankyrin repeat-containing domain protein [Ostreococcus tauri]|uniref:Ankyrin repeat-containing domain protein n=1 Tax=Ostreococcus tauri TaxID=70448 RepID=A0A1Y5IIS8_OSTTA|nr:ankyrin repeat-containing domain protein [Ostreococcus tauri]
MPPRTAPCDDRECACGRRMCASQTMAEFAFERGVDGRAAVGDLAGVLDALARETRCGGIVAPRREGRTALHHAARAGSLACVEALLERGFDATATTVSGRATALHKACAGGHAMCARALVAAGGDARARDVDGETALHKACASGDGACVDAVGRAWPEGAWAMDARGRTPRMCARTEAATRAIAVVEALARESGDENEKASRVAAAWTTSETVGRTSETVTASSRR